MTAYKPTPERCAELIKDHQFTQLAKTDSVEVWRCKTPGTHSYAFDLTMSRYGMAMYGDTGALVFDVGSSADYGLKFLAKDDDDYVYGKLDHSSRETDLDEAYLLEIVYGAIIDLLDERDLELPEWFPDTEPMADRVEQLSQWLLGSECKDAEHSALVVALRGCQNLENRSTAGAYEWLSDHQELLELGDDLDYSLGKPTNSVMQRIYMLRHAAKQILALKEASPELYSGTEQVAVVVCSAAPGPGDECRFIELEDGQGKSMRVGEWESRPDGTVQLAIPLGRHQPNPSRILEQGFAVKALCEELQCVRGFILARHAFENDEAAIETMAGIDKALSSYAWAIPRIVTEGPDRDWENEPGVVVAQGTITFAMPTEPAIEYAYAKAAPSDNWSNDSLASIVSDNDLKAGDVIQRGVTSKSAASSFLPDIDDVVNHMANQASSESEFADHFPDLTDAQQDELDTLMEPMRAWVDKNCDVRFYEVSKIEPYTITDADVVAGEAYKAQLETLV